MTKILAISEANAIAFHAMALIAKSQISINANDIAEITKSSKHHTSKVLQRLVKEGLLGSTRGPSGGFYLKRPAKDIQLIEILEAIEGELQVNECPIDNDVCPFGSCIMGGICYDIGDTMLKYLRDNDLQSIIDNIDAEQKIF
ncbi:MAG: Rrf2 family transcriptional regulator [Marinilabiliales bacterium]|nr:MAG: Rrf2 family transcriptional regulator [Marinilabiliales bacterium]